MSIHKYSIIAFIWLMIAGLPSKGQQAPQAIIMNTIGPQEVYVGARIQIFCSTLYNEGQIEFSMDDTSNYVKLVDMGRGYARITVTPGDKDVGFHLLTVKVTSEAGEAIQKIKLYVLPMPDEAKVLYLDPVNGKLGNSGDIDHPLPGLEAYLESKPTIEPGSFMMLMSGNHGKIRLNRQNDSTVFVLAAAGEMPMAESMRFNFASEWYISGLQVSPTVAGAFVKEDYIYVSGASDYITITNCFIYGTRNISDWPTNQHWYDNAGNGITCSGEDCSFVNNFILNTDFPVQLLSPANTFAYNIIDQFSGDAMRGLGDGDKFLFNQVKNATVFDYNEPNGNHDDGFQSWTTGRPVRGIQIRGNQITDISYRALPLQTQIMQGIVDFDGFAEDWVVENNLVVIHHAHGIALYGANYCKIVNNTVVKNPFQLYNPTHYPWIRINKTKQKELSKGNLTRNNIMSQSIQEDHPGTIDHNRITTQYEKVYRNYKKWDFRPSAGSKAIGTGLLEDAPADDLTGGVRKRGQVDLGCFGVEGVAKYKYPPVKIEKITFDHITSTSVRVSWHYPKPNIMLKFFHVWLDDEELLVEPSISDCYRYGLLPDTKYKVTIVAEDYAGQFSEPATALVTTVPWDEEKNIGIYSIDPFDIEITDFKSQEWIGKQRARIGGVGNRDYVYIMPFRLPPLSVIKTVTVASIRCEITDKVGRPNGNIDLYGLGYKRKREMDSNWFWQGAFGEDPGGAIPLVDDYIPSGTLGPVIESDTAYGRKIMDFLKAQYANGAHGGDYVYFRLNMDVPNVDKDAYFELASGNDYNPFHHPRLMIRKRSAIATSDLPEEAGVRLFPNPGSSSFLLSCEEELHSLRVFTPDGTPVLRRKMTKGKSCFIRTDKWPVGMYYVLVETNTGIIVRRFVKE